MIRIRYVRKFAPTADLSWDIAPAISWSLIELLSTVICLNLPPCRALISKLIPRRLATTIHKGHNGTGAYGAYGAYGAVTDRGAQTIELKNKPPMGGILHTTTIEVTHERNLSDDEYLIAKTRPSVSSAASRRSLQTIDEEYDDLNERGRTKVRRPPAAATVKRTPSVDVEIDRSRLGLYNFFPHKS